MAKQNEIAPLTTQVPEHIARAIAERRSGAVAQTSVMDDLLQGSKFPYPRISIRAGRYRLVSEGVETSVGITMDVVIVGANPHVSKIYYSKPYDPNATDMRPDCFSNDGIRPDSSVADPVSKACTTCPNGILGSKITPSGAKAKLCADQRHLCVVSAADPKTLYSLTVPVSSMKSLREYMTSLKNRMLVPEEVVTELSFDDTTSYPRIVFSQKTTADGVPIFLSEEATLAVRIVQEKKAQQIKEITRQVPVTTAAVSEEEDSQDSGPTAAVAGDTETTGEELPVTASSPEIEAQLDKLMGRKQN